MCVLNLVLQKSVCCVITIHINTTIHPYCDDHFTSISACGVWGVRAGIQVSRRELHTHIHLDYVRVEFYLVSKKKKKNYSYKYCF